MIQSVLHSVIVMKARILDLVFYIALVTLLVRILNYATHARKFIQRVF